MITQEQLNRATELLDKAYYLSTTWTDDNIGYHMEDICGFVAEALSVLNNQGDSA